MDLSPLLAPDAASIEPMFCILVPTLAYCVRHYILSVERIEARLGGESGPDRQARAVVVQRTAAAILFVATTLALLVAFARSPLTGLGTIDVGRTLLATVVGTLIIAPIPLLSARKPDLWDTYPEMRGPDVAKKWVRHSAWSRALFLFGYEALFRGYLTFVCVDLFGLWPGLSIMTALYVLAHLDKPAPETFSCLAMGFVFGLMALWTGSFIAPWLLHCIIAIGSETVAGRSNPAIRWGT